MDYSAAGAAAGGATAAAAALARGAFSTAGSGAVAPWALRKAAHRFFVAATMRARPSALILRLAWGSTTFSFVALKAAHLFFCANAMRLRAAALMVRFPGAR